MNDFSTPQEALWAGDFGTAYTGRNAGSFVTGRLSFWSKILSRIGKPDSVIELGANIGDNLRAIRLLSPQTILRGVEINQSAFERLGEIDGIERWNASLLNFAAAPPSTLSFTSGVLIHINPDELPKAYATLYEASSRFVLVSEYYNPSPVTVPYRGNSDALFKRDWCADLRATYPDLRLVDYGFMYHADLAFPMDDLTWFLLEKQR